MRWKKIPEQDIQEIIKRIRKWEDYKSIAEYFWINKSLVMSYIPDELRKYKTIAQREKWVFIKMMTPEQYKEYEDSIKHKKLMDSKDKECQELDKMRDYYKN